MRQVLGAALVIALAYPAAKLLATPRTWRYRRRTSIVSVLLAAYIGSVLTLAVIAPAVLYVLAVFAVFALLAFGWRLRPNYGVSRGLPPGPLDLIPMGPSRDPQFFLKMAEKYGPVFKIGTPYPDLQWAPTVCVVGHREAAVLLRDQSDQLRSGEDRVSRWIPKGFLRYMNPEDHETYREVFRFPLSPRTIREFEPFMAEVVAEQFQQLAEEDGFASLDAHLEALVSRIMTRVLGGLPDRSDEAARFLQALASVHPRRVNRFRDPAQRRAMGEMFSIIRSRGVEIRQHPDHDDPHSVVGKLLEAHPESLDDPTVVGNLVYMVRVGTLDSIGLLRWMLYQLLDHPVWMARLVTQGEGALTSTGMESLAHRVVMETLRMEQSEYLIRRAVTELECSGYRIPKGWSVRFCIREGHRDASTFDRPDVFDPDRFLEHSFEATEYAPFGLDQHRCLGRSLAVSLAASVAIEAARYTWEISGDTRPVFDFFHWSPDADLRVRLRGRGGAPLR